MTFQIKALPRAAFENLFALGDDDLARHGAVRQVATKKPGFPCRVSLADAEPGDSVLLVNFEHQSADTPYRSRHAVYVREQAEEARCGEGEVPDSLRRRILSLRAFDRLGMMVDAELVDGTALEGRSRACSPTSGSDICTPTTPSSVATRPGSTAPEPVSAARPCGTSLQRRAMRLRPNAHRPASGS